MTLAHGTRRPVLAGNWKMNGSRSDSVTLARALIPLLQDLSTIEQVICPPFLHIDAVSRVIEGQSGIKLGAQDCSAFASGAYTGDISASQIKDSNASHVIIGHSERRQYHGESGTTIKDKIERAREAGLKIILCVGESRTIRDAGQSEDVVLGQIRDVLSVLDIKDTVIAYEPVWAIGTGLTASPEDAQSMHRAIRGFLQENLADGGAMRILYGGSVKPDNALALAQGDDIDGFLVGGASLKADDFKAIGVGLTQGKGL
jgi:triosephosphate isomerase